jgi:hypothetical protein
VLGGSQGMQNGEQGMQGASQGLQGGAHGLQGAQRVPVSSVLPSDSHPASSMRSGDSRLESRLDPNTGVLTAATKTVTYAPARALEM